MTDDKPPSTGTAGASQVDDPGGRAVAVTDEQDVPLHGGRLAALAARALDLLRVPAEAEVTITLVTPGRIAELKERALGERAPTDVLSFPIDDPGDPMPGPLVLGDVVLCPAFALRQARALGRTLDDEAAQLAVHGILHLLGHDHHEPRDELAMAQTERAVLRATVSEAA